jgi:hypothetical protein
MLFCACLLALSPSCSFTRVFSGYSRNDRQSSHDKQAQQALYATTGQARADIANGQYKKALELFAGAYTKYHTPEMRENYSSAGEAVRQTADQTFRRRNFAEAGNIYNELAESGITRRDFAGTLSFNEAYLGRQIHECSKALLEAGLTTYRDGKLEDAISIWKQAQIFDRDNREIKRAIDTATTQLRNLKKLI